MTGAEYAALYDEVGSYTEVARRFGVDESTVRKAVQRYKTRSSMDPAIQESMEAIGTGLVPGDVWVKTKNPGGTSYSVRLRPEAKPPEEVAERIDEILSKTPAVKLEPPQATSSARNFLGFIPLNDLHAGGYAWAPETGYEDWDTDKAVRRLQKWVHRAVSRMPQCSECILYYNGDTLHTNGEDPFTPASKHVLDKDTRHYRVVDLTAAGIIATVECAAQKHEKVRLVIKRGNHDEDSYLALLLAAKYRFREQRNVIVEEDPSPYWAYRWHEVFLFGHHGDRVKPAELVMKMAADHRDEWGKSTHCYVWTAHLHQRSAETFPGATWERASCLTAPDAYGAKWGSHAQLVAVVYHRSKGEYERHIVRS